MTGPLTRLARRHRHLCLVGAATGAVLLGSAAGGPLGLLVLPVVLTVPGYLLVAAVPGHRHGIAWLPAWLAVPAGLALIVLAGLLSWLVLGSYRTWAVAGLLAAGAVVPARLLDHRGVPLPRVDRRLVAGSVAVTVVGATAFALTGYGSVIPDEEYLQVRFTGGTAPLSGAAGERRLGIEIVNHTARRSAVVVAARWGRWASGPASRVVPPAGTVASTIRLPAAVPCRGTIEVLVTPAGHSPRRLTREVQPGDC